MRTDVDDWGDAKVFDYVAVRLGIGTYDEASETMDYHKWRLQQISMLKRTRKARNLSPAEVIMCVDYCVAHRIMPYTYSGLFVIYRQAREWDQSARAGMPTLLREELLHAIDYEQALADRKSGQWVSRFLRTSPDYAEGVLSEWRESRGLPASSSSQAS